MLYLRIREVLGDAIDAMWVDFFPQRTQAINATTQRHGEMWDARWRGALFPPRSRWRSFFRDFDPWKMRAWHFSSIKLRNVLVSLQTSRPVKVDETSSRSGKECCKQLSEVPKMCCQTHFTNPWFGGSNPLMKVYLGGGLKYFWNFHPYLGKIPILTNIFQMGWNHQPDLNTSVGSYTYRPFQ